MILNTLMYMPDNSSGWIGQDNVIFLADNRVVANKYAVVYHQFSPTDAQIHIKKHNNKIYLNASVYVSKNFIFGNKMAGVIRYPLELLQKQGIDTDSFITVEQIYFDTPFETYVKIRDENSNIPIITDFKIEFEDGLHQLLNEMIVNKVKKTDD